MNDDFGTALKATDAMAFAPSRTHAKDAVSASCPRAWRQ